MSRFPPIGQTPPNSTVRADTWLQDEEYAYPRGGFTRYARVRVRQNDSHPDARIAPIVGTLPIVRCSIPDTFFSIPARLKTARKTVRGYISVIDDVFTFTPEAL